MSDLISRQDAIDVIVRQTNFDNVDGIRYECRRNYEKDNGWLGGLKDALNAIIDLPTAEMFEAWNRRIERTAKVERDTIFPVKVCGICHSTVDYPDKYCSECGAKLDWSE